MFDIKSEFLFPKQVIISDDTQYHQYKNELVEYCYEQYNKNPEGLKYTNIGGWQSDPFFMMYDKDLEFFNLRLKENVSTCLLDHFKIRDDVSIQVPRMWINISGNNHYNKVHTHPFSHYSGVFYVQTPNNCGNIGFYQDGTVYQETLFRLQEFRERKKILSHLDYTPVEGRLLLFPSTLPHDVAMNVSDCDRISISFDIVFN